MRVAAGLLFFATALIIYGAKVYIFAHFGMAAQIFHLEYQTLTKTRVFKEISIQ